MNASGRQRGPNPPVSDGRNAGRTARAGGRLLRRAIVLACTLSLLAGGYAAAASLTFGTTRLGAGDIAPPQCMAGSTATFTYDTSTSGDISSVVVGDIATTCGGEVLKAELVGTAANLPMALDTSGTIASTSTHCTTSSGKYHCTFGVAAAVAPADVTGNDVSITGP